MAYPYAWDYRFYYPVFYWSFFLLMLVTDLLFKKYRIGQEKEEKAMEAEVKATIEDTQKLMVNSGTLYGPGGEGFIRLNIACPRTLLADGLERIAHVLVQNF